MTRRYSAPKEFVYDPPDEPLRVLYCDDDIVVVCKPAELLSVAGRKDEHQVCLAHRVQDEFPTARIIHRLDMCTSGVMIFALNADAQRNLGQQFEKRKTQKIYIARVWGEVQAEKGEIDLPLICDWPNRPVQKVDHIDGKSALTRWEVIAREKGVTRVALYPVTGRTHQLRIHMAEIDHPILGDDFYAHHDAFHAEDRLHLHAHKLMVYHPHTHVPLWFESPCPF